MNEERVGLTAVATSVIVLLVVVTLCSMTVYVAYHAGVGAGKHQPIEIGKIAIIEQTGDRRLIKTPLDVGETVLVFVDACGAVRAYPVDEGSLFIKDGKAAAISGGVISWLSERAYDMACTANNQR